jgi:hypothetical protein
MFNKTSKYEAEVDDCVVSLTLPVLPGALEARFELHLHIANPQIMEIFLVTFLILN